MSSTSRKTAKTRKNGKEQNGCECSDDNGKSPIVKVTFTTPPDDFAFSCQVACMGAAGKVLMHQASPHDDWVFLHTNGLPTSQFSEDVEGNGKTMIITDKNKAPGDFYYTVTIRDGQGCEHTSPDHRIVTTPPMIRNR